MSKCSLAWFLRYLSIVFWGGGIFLLAYLMFVVCKAISFYMKKASYNWKFIAEKCDLLPRNHSSSWCACITCTYASYQERECHSAPDNFVFPSVSHRGHICLTPPYVVYQGQKTQRFSLFSSLLWQTPEFQEKKGRQDTQCIGTTHHKNIPQVSSQSLPNAYTDAQAAEQTPDHLKVSPETPSRRGSALEMHGPGVTATASPDGHVKLFWETLCKGQEKKAASWAVGK